MLKCVVPTYNPKLWYFGDFTYIIWLPNYVRFRITDLTRLMCIERDKKIGERNLFPCICYMALKYRLCMILETLNGKYKRKKIKKKSRRKIKNIFKINKLYLLI